MSAAIKQRHARRRVRDLKEHPRNPRRGDLDALDASIRANGYYGALVVQKSTGIVLAGNHRLKALHALGRSDDEIDVIEVDVDDDRALRILLADNRVSDLGDYDDEALADVLRELQASTQGVEGLGYDEEALDEILATADSTPDPGAPPAPPEPESARGEVYVLGPHRLVCGDATNADDVAKCLRGERPRLMVTDPPYGVEYDAAWRNEAAEKGLLSFAPRRVGAVLNDDRADWSEVWALSPADVVYCWHAAGPLACVVAASLDGVGFELRPQIIWAKPHFPIGRGHYTVQHEPCWYGVRKGATSGWIGPMNETTVWKIALDKNVEGGHSTQKPIECMERPIRNHKGDVFDPFLGSGTTLIAAARQKRRCFGLEINPAYCDVIRRRWAQWAKTAGVDPGEGALA